jgi:alpha-galactosidase
MSAACRSTIILALAGASLASATCPVLETSVATFRISGSGSISASMDSLSLDDGGVPASTVIANGRPVRDFVLDCAHATTGPATGRFGASGKKIEITAKSAALPSLEESITFETYDDFPAVLFSTVSWRNTGTADLTLNNVAIEQHRLNASHIDPRARPYDMWSFQGASEQWGKDDVVKLSASFTRANPMQQLTFGSRGAGGAGGGIPVVAFWTRQLGEAIGQVENIPLVLSMPVRTANDGRVSASVSVNAETILRSGEQWSAPETFLAVFHGDFYEPLHLYSELLRRQNWAPAHPIPADYQANWCGWGYQSKFTPQQIIGTIPKIREYGIRWATLDDGWYDNRGDWNPRTDIGDAGIRNIVDTFHRAGLKITLWWIPLAVENGGRDILDGGAFHVSSIAREHPEWLIEDEHGKPAPMAGHFAALCPAIPEVRDYYQRLTRRFIQDWGFDGNKLDVAYTVPPCYNPAHHHKSPQDSVRAVGDIYRAIFETTRALKPESVTQICPCGTTPSLAWLGDFDQAVTADPVGSVQVRRRIKMYKALLGPEAPVFGDHVELTRITDIDTNEQDIGRDFASTVGAGGVVGTKFTWPASQYHDALLTPDKEPIWKKWLAIYNSKMLSSGTFRNLYIYGYDFPEAYAIEKDGRMYYAFFSTQSTPMRIELRGLGPGRYHVIDYETGRDYGKLTGPTAMLTTRFTDHLLLEATRVPE